ncbi:L,D-transpeptidase family protein [Sphingomonas sp. RP10(2022)]|uniref:L,D-transpeptidase family protein n=1 Tax=Sphingomonas liriopis TaxID=2949094 RepID=A0A9X2HPQ8_9SPHN|nr:L,D-transpeptidase family protein [Sphingomonas liriopis]MCP3734888.1 L,D-transpeptidase family protein [Sphingomonas liriopis]
MTRTIATVAIAALLLPAMPAAAQLAPPVVAVPQLAPPALPTLALPQLTDAQAAQLAALLSKDTLAQGLTLATPPPMTAAARDQLVRDALDHARAVHAGRLAEADFQRDWGLRPPTFDPLPGFADAVRRDRIAAWFAALPPPYAGYDGLKAGLERYRAIAAAGGWPVLATGPDLTLGATGERVIALRQRLAVEDRDVATTGDRFDLTLLEAVRRAQRRYGLNPTGNLAAQTLAALNVPATARVRQIMANMERWRWLPQQLPKDRIQVNIAAAVLTVFDGDQPVMSMRAVTGRPGDETPMLSSTIHSVVINPPWNVPTSIATNELWPKEKKNPGYLRRNGFKVIGGTRLQQQAGDQSALGRYKFDFDNAFSVYLHDTPSRAKFASFSRLASHGCVRLEKPADLAELLLKGDPTWTPEGIAAAVDKGDTVRARLPKPVSVYLLYWTAFASGNGQMNFRDDPYGWDATLAAKIEARSARQALAAR